MALSTQLLNKCLATKKLIDSNLQTLNKLEELMNIVFKMLNLKSLPPDLLEFFTNVEAYINSAQRVFVKLTEKSMMLSMKQIKEIATITQNLEKNFQRLCNIATQVLIVSKQVEIDKILQSCPEGVTTMDSIELFMKWILGQQYIDLCMRDVMIQRISRLKEMPGHELQLREVWHVLNALLNVNIGADANPPLVNNAMCELKSRVKADRVKLEDFKASLQPLKPMSSSASSLAPSKRSRPKDDRQQQEACKKACSTMISVATV